MYKMATQSISELSEFNLSCARTTTELNKLYDPNSIKQLTTKFTPQILTQYKIINNGYEVTDHPSKIEKLFQQQGRLDMNTDELIRYRTVMNQFQRLPQLSRMDLESNQQTEKENDRISGMRRRQSLDQQYLVRKNSENVKNQGQNLREPMKLKSLSNTRKAKTYKQNNYQQMSYRDIKLLTEKKFDRNM
ncbi:Hypothetical_protein [Hexamita inflata]|uniref:Hypothetical_protein n=1 Tax=Hexamita inflata TaxID=28002 RepID=A0AA86V5I0_9EUKA|nr:Hypothetical protein HINF_LOCUS64861 [Hexamita inflata]